MQNLWVKISIAAGAILILALIVYSSLGQSGVTCEVCVSYRGATQCRSASGSTRDTAIRTATDNACAVLSSGMTDSISCGNTRPATVTCDPG